MTTPALLNIEIDGRTATVEQLIPHALDSAGHFTALQVRGGRTRGLGLHLTRLDEASHELWGLRLDGERVRALVRQALGARQDASVRVVVRRGDDGPSVLVTVRPPGEMPAGAWRLRSVAHRRAVAHIKHLSSFAHVHYGDVARRDGFDDVLLTQDDGAIAEAAIANIAFYDGSGIVWPDAPQLPGITKLLLEPRLAEAGLPARRAQVTLGDLSRYRAAFLTNSRGIAPVSGIDEVAFGVDEKLMQTLGEVYEGVPWDEI
ncbi:aminotransferase class IV [Streptomyces sp. NBC_01304]|uniref:aminotransferase class IV n=1 Tax=Streptomyces sp. NBC_01304 TaxID=2903818 RepID=UPI002E0FD9FA|nr:aminotransferase class IV [Streptomyces sp. NBC_01304]